MEAKRWLHSRIRRDGPARPSSSARNAATAISADRLTPIGVCDSQGRELSRKVRSRFGPLGADGILDRRYRASRVALYSRFRDASAPRSDH
jgi:hypothetical protein